MSPDARITTVIPTFRRPQLLRRAIFSVLRQTYPHVRVAVCDNASGDETAEVVAGIMRQDPRVTYWCHPMNVGSYRNFNYGMQSVETPFFSLLSDDDMLAPHFYELGMQAFDRHSRAMFVTTNSVVIDTSGQIISGPVGPAAPTFYEAGQGFFDMAAVRIPNTWTGMIFRTAVREEIGLVDLEAGAFADGGFVLHAAARFPFVALPEICTVLMAHANSTSGTMGVASKEWYGWAERMINQIESDTHVPESVRLGARAVMMPDLARIGFNQFLKALVGGDQARAAALVDTLTEGLASPLCAWEARLLFKLRNIRLFQVLLHRLSGLRRSRFNNRYRKLTQEYGSRVNFIQMLEERAFHDRRCIEENVSNI